MDPENKPKLYDPSTLGFIIGRFILKIVTIVLFIGGFILVIKYPNGIKGLYLSLLGWFTYFAYKLLSPRLVPGPPEGEE